MKVYVRTSIYIESNYKQISTAALFARVYYTTVSQQTQSIKDYSHWPKAKIYTAI